MLECRDASSEAVLHFGVGRSDVLVLRGRSSLNMGFGVRADTGGTEGNVALFCFSGDVQCEQ